MGRHRIDLYRRDRPEKRRGKSGRPLSLATCLKAFVGISVIMAGLATLLWALGIMDFTAERGYVKFTPFGIESTRRKATFCGFAFLFLPDHLESRPLCIGLNIFPFTVLPLFVLLVTLRRLFTGARD